MTGINYHTADVDGRKIFYREAGAPEAPKLLLLHGFPTAGHMFRDLIPLLADRYHIIAPDLPGFGNSDMPRGATHSTRSPRRSTASRRSSASTATRSICSTMARRPGSGSRSSIRPHHGDHLPERQRLRGRTKRRLESDPGLLGGCFARQSRGAARVPQAGDDRLAVHARCSRHDDGSPRTAIRSTITI